MSASDDLKTLFFLTKRKEKEAIESFKQPTEKQKQWIYLSFDHSFWHIPKINDNQSRQTKVNCIGYEVA